MRTSCQISYIPIGNPDYINEVNQVIEIINQFDVIVEVGELSTILKGDLKEILKTIEAIYTAMDEKKYRFTIHTMVSNTCGCEV